MATQPPSRLPPSAGPISGTPAPGDQSSAAPVNLSSLWLQFESAKQLGDILAQQAALRMKAAMSAGPAGVSSVASLILDHDTLANLNQSVDGLSSFLLQAKLLSQSPTLGGDSSGDYNTVLAELNLLGKSLAEMDQGTAACGSMTFSDGTRLSGLEGNIIQAIGHLDASQVAVILYATLYSGDTSKSGAQFTQDLRSLAAKDSPLAPLAKQALTCSPMPCPLDGKWTADSLNRLTAGLSVWFTSPTDNPNGYWGKMQWAGLQAALTEPLQTLGQNGNALANNDIGCFSTISKTLLAVAEVGGDASFLTQLYDTGSGILSFGFFIAARCASYYVETIIGSGGDATTLINQLDRFKDQYHKINPTASYPDSLGGIEEFVKEMTGPNPTLQPVGNATDILVAPLMAMTFGTIPKPLSKEEALAQAMVLFAPERAKAIVDAMERANLLSDSEVSTKRGDNANKETRG